MQMLKKTGLDDKEFRGCPKRVFGSVFTFSHWMAENGVETHDKENPNKWLPNQ